MLRTDAIRAIADQGLWAIRSLLLVALIAQSSTAAEFGVFAVCLGTLLLLSGLTVSVSGEVLAVTRGRLLLANPAAGDAPANVVAVTERSLGSVFVVAACAPVAALAVGASFGGGADSTIWLLILSGPAMVVAEGTRAVNYATRRPGAAAAVSAAWLVVQVGVVLAAVLVVGLDGPWVMLAWVCGAHVAAGVGLLALRTAPRFSGASRMEWARRRQFCAEYLATTGPTHATVFLAGGMLGLAAAGSLRALQSLYGPLNVVLGGIANAVIPAKAQDPHQSHRTGGAVAAAAVITAAGATAALALVPAIGLAVMGENWPDQAGLVMAYGVGRCAQGLIFGAMVVYRAHDGGRYSWKLRGATAVLILVGFVLGGFEGLNAAVWASSLGALAASLLWWGWVPRLVRSSQLPSGRRHADPAV